MGYFDTNNIQYHNHYGTYSICSKAMPYSCQIIHLMCYCPTHKDNRHRIHYTGSNDIIFIRDLLSYSKLYIYFNIIVNINLLYCPFRKRTKLCFTVNQIKIKTNPSNPITYLCVLAPYHSSYGPNRTWQYKIV